jgi:hypothetical protein
MWINNYAVYSADHGQSLLAVAVKVPRGGRLADTQTRHATSDPFHVPGAQDSGRKALASARPPNRGLRHRRHSPAHRAGRRRGRCALGRRGRPRPCSACTSWSWPPLPALRRSLGCWNRIGHWGLQGATSLFARGATACATRQPERKLRCGRWRISLSHPCVVVELVIEMLQSESDLRNFPIDRSGGCHSLDY